MKKKVIISSLIILPFIFLMASSCGTKTDKNEQLAKIDSLKMTVDRIELKLNEIDLGETDKAYLEYRLNMKEIIAHVDRETDSISGKYLMAYAHVREPFKSFIKSHPRLKKDIEKTRKQLDDLYHDVEKDILEVDKFEAYVRAESDTIRIMNNWITKYVVKVKEQLVNFDTVNPKIKKIIEFHKNN